MRCALCKLNCSCVFLGHQPPCGRKSVYSSELNLVSSMSLDLWDMTLSFPPYRCLYPQPCVPGLGAEGLSAERAQSGLPSPVCPANWGWGKRDPVLSAAPGAETCHARALGNGPGLGADPEEAWERLGWHICTVRYAQDREDCVTAGLGSLLHFLPHWPWAPSLPEIEEL